MGGRYSKLLLTSVGPGAHAASYVEQFAAGSSSLHVVGGTWLEPQGVRFSESKHTRAVLEWQAGKELQPGEIPR
eukprot:1402145-Amphidinium_carterae.1